MPTLPTKVKIVLLLLALPGLLFATHLSVWLLVSCGGAVVAALVRSYFGGPVE